jgi:hypothetical protein
MRHQKTNCNCFECVWERILLHAKKQIILLTKRGKKLTYTIENDYVIWIPLGSHQNVLYNQSKKQICASLNARNLNYNPSQYPGKATSYKWALLNHESIWL